MVGKGKDTHSSTAALEHQSRPLASLKDPDTFGPPPKNLAFHGAAASPHTSSPDRAGLDIPSNTQRIKTTDGQQQSEAQPAEDLDQGAAAPPIPYRVDTTGLSTSHLSNPPVRRLDHDSRPSNIPPSPGNKPRPALPPRLPPRQSPAPAQSTIAPPPPYAKVIQSPVQGNYVNQGALNRLGSAGVSVPGLGIGRESQDANPWRDQRGSNPNTATPSSPTTQTPQLNELRSNFSQMSTKSQSPDTPIWGTSFAEKQSALQTVNSLRSDPSSVSLSDAKTTASTVNNFHERHSDQVAAGWKNASAVNRKYDVGNKVNNLATNGSTLSRNEATNNPGSVDPLNSLVSLGKKRAPPPPLKKLHAENNSVASPPSIPFSSKPKP